MGAPEPPAGGAPGAPEPVVQPPRYGRYVVLLVIVILVGITINTISTKPNGGAGIAPGGRLAPFAAPLATGGLAGDVNVATGPDQGGAGKVPACSVRGPRVLNICQLYEKGPVVLALFVASGSCPDVLSKMQTLTREFPQVSFAAVAVKGGTSGVSKLVNSKGLTFPVGLDRDGALAALYKVASCPQLTFAVRGGVVHGRAMLNAPSTEALRMRVRDLVAASRADGSGG